MAESDTAWVKSNGEFLEIRTVSPVLMSFRADRSKNQPLPHVNETMSLEDARQLQRKLMATGNYVRTK